MSEYPQLIKVFMEDLKIITKYHRGNTIDLNCAVDQVCCIPYMLKPAVHESIDSCYSLG